MKSIRILIALAIPVMAAAMVACAALSGSNALKGTINGAANLQAVLEMIHLDNSKVAIGRAACDANGSFTIEQKEDWKEGIYMLTLGQKRAFFLFDGSEKTVEVTADLATIDRMNMQVKGSEATSQYVAIFSEVMANPTAMNVERTRETVKKGNTPLMRAFLAMQLMGRNPEPFMADLKAAGAELTAKMPDSKYTVDFNTTIANLEKQLAQAGAEEAIKVGEQAPEISLPGPDGKTHSLSGMKGKVVLLDFWASWCGPCRKANPHVVEVYNKYKSRGFDVFSVSLDGSDPRMKLSPEETNKKKAEGKAKWEAAIKQDGLVWDNHVSDLLHWGSVPAATYGVSAIPKTFLIGRDGKIVAINPRDNLEAELLKVL
jgi:thiol-disulfide isomerase/thioredoxin